jgi:hypothetical protein
MLSHATARDWLIPYADGMLAADERRRVDGHIAACADCAAELGEVRQLNLLLVSLPPAPPVAFAPFWLKLQAVLPQRRSLRTPSIFNSRRVGIAFALATAGVLVAAATALAAPAAMPDSPLYPVKQLEESIQLVTVPTSGRLAVELQQASERLIEARQMAANHKPLLAADSLRAFQVTLNGAAARLKNPADPRVAAEDLKRLQAGLDAVERENAARDDDDSVVRLLVVSAANDLQKIEHPGQGTPVPTLIVGRQVTPEPSAAPAPKPQPKPTLRPTPRPEPSDDKHHD